MFITLSFQPQQMQLNIQFSTWEIWRPNITHYTLSIWKQIKLMSRRRLGNQGPMKKVSRSRHCSTVDTVPAWLAQGLGFVPQKWTNWVWWYIPVIPTPGGRGRDLKLYSDFETNYVKHCLEQNQSGKWKYKYKRLHAPISWQVAPLPTFLLGWGSRYIIQASLELPVSCDLPTSASWIARTTDVSCCVWTLNDLMPVEAVFGF